MRGRPAKNPKHRGTVKIKSARPKVDADGQPIDLGLTQEQRWSAVESMTRDVTKRGMGVTAAVRRMALKFGTHEMTMWALWKKYRDSRHIAGIYLKAQAFRMAQSIVEHGTPADHIDVLTRPNIAVLQPTVKGETGGTGLFISVSAATCGAMSATNVQIQEWSDGQTVHREREEGSDPLDAEALEAADPEAGRGRGDPEPGPEELGGIDERVD